MTFHATILTLFPEMFPGPLGQSLAGKALAEGTWQLDAVNIRDFATDKHQSVDDTPYGGGAGMVMRADIVDAAIQAQDIAGRQLVYMSPRGAVFDQKMAIEWAKGDGVIILCGRYEGVDQRVLDHWQIQEVSMGDMILSGGELAAMTMLDATIRLIPGVMGKIESGAEESFSHGLLEYPHYTRPREWQNKAVPDVLAGGNHAEISRWRLEQAEKLTQSRRPDLWQKYLKNK